MYAPKFRSWMTDEERFHSALEARIAPLLQEMRAECKAMIYLAESSLGLRPINEQMKYNTIADQLIPRNRNEQMSYWYSAQQNLGASELNAFGAAFGNPYGNPNPYKNWGLFE